MNTPNNALRTETVKARSRKQLLTDESEIILVMAMAEVKEERRRQGHHSSLLVELQVAVAAATLARRRLGLGPCLAVDSASAQCQWSLPVVTASQPGGKPRRSRQALTRSAASMANATCLLYGDAFDCPLHPYLETAVRK